MRVFVIAKMADEMARYQMIVGVIYPAICMSLSHRHGYLSLAQGD